VVQSDLSIAESNLGDLPPQDRVAGEKQIIGLGAVLRGLEAQLKTCRVQPGRRARINRRAPRPAEPSNASPTCAAATQIRATQTPAKTPTDSPGANATYSNSLPPATATSKSPPPCTSAPKPPTPTICAIKTKLGVHNRTQAAAYAHYQAPSPQ
jgi:hypothetical protein